MFRAKKSSDWTLVPATRKEIDAAREKCRRRVARRAAISAGVSVVPLPGIDITIDVVLLSKLLREANTEFGLTPDQIDTLLPEVPARTCHALFGSDGLLAVQSAMRAMLLQLVKRAGTRLAVGNRMKTVPFARHIASAVWGYAAFRTIAYQHIEECARAAEGMINLQANPVH